MDQLSSLFSSAGAFTLLVLGFCFLILIHELGHFLAAKAVDMKVSQFALGIGPAIFAWRKGIGFRWGSTEPEYNKLILEQHTKELNQAGKEPQTRGGEIAMPAPAEIDRLTRNLGLGETEYRVNWLVILGGYVKLLGQEDLNPQAVSEDLRSFNRKPAWARAVVLSAGVVMNVIFGLLFFIVAFMAGVAFPPAIVGDTLPGGPAAMTYAQGHDNDPDYRGLRPGDRVTLVNGDPITDFTELAMRSALTGPGESLSLTVQRDGLAEPLNFVVTPAAPDENSRVKVFSLGVSQPLSPRIWKDAKASELPAVLVNAGVAPGMVAKSVDGKPIERFDQLEAALARAKGVYLPVVFTDETGKSVTAMLSALPQPQVGRDDIVNMLGLTPVTKVSSVAASSPAESAGIKPDDIIARIGDIYWPRADQIVNTVRSADGRKLAIEVFRDGQLVTLPPTAPTRKKILGIGMGVAMSSNIVAGTLADSPVGSLKLAPGSRVLAVNDSAIETLSDFTRLMLNAIGDPAKPSPVRVKYRNNLGSGVDGETEITLTPEMASTLAATEWVFAQRGGFEPLVLPLSSSDPLHAAALGFKKTHQFMTQTYLTIVRLVQGRVDHRELRGIVGIADEGTRIAKQGGTYLLFFLGLLSVNLAVMNFLPIPILDGGQMLFLLIEKLKGSPVSIRVQEIATYVGLALIGSLLLVTLYYDTGRLLGL